MTVFENDCNSKDIGSPEVRVTALHWPFPQQVSRTNSVKKKVSRTAEQGESNDN
jgi:hypothetical protein